MEIPKLQNKEQASSWRREQGPEVEAALGGGCWSPQWARCCWVLIPRQAEHKVWGVQKVGRRLRPLSEAISKISKGCTLPESVTRKKIHPPTQGPNLELGLGSGGQTKEPAPWAEPDLYHNPVCPWNRPRQNLYQLTHNMGKKTGRIPCCQTSNIANMLLRLI